MGTKGATRSVFLLLRYSALKVYATGSSNFLFASMCRTWRPLLACLAHRQAVHGLDPSRTLRLLSRCLQQQQRRAAEKAGIKENDDGKQRRAAEKADNWDVEAVVLSQMLEASPHVHHRAVLELVVELVQKELTTQTPTGLFPFQIGSN